MWDESQLRKYGNMTFDSIPRYPVNDPRIDELMAENKPVVITGTNLVKSARRWDLEFFEKHLGNSECTVAISRNHTFKYYDTGKVTPRYFAEFAPNATRTSLQFDEFVRRFRNWKEGDERLYLQQMLNTTMGSGIVDDFIRFRWDWISERQKIHNWGPLSYNMLLLGMEGNVTPCHYDEQQNMFAQLRGYKRFILFPPEQFECFYPHTVDHPYDRQSQVDFEDPNYLKFPKFAEARGQEAVIGPGEVLFIPIYWWHQVECLMRGGYTVSVNFWYKAAPMSNLGHPLKITQKISIMRNIEKMLFEALQSPEEVAAFLQSMVIGRYVDFNRTVHHPFF